MKTYSRQVYLLDR
jgi:hypothetical protein